ncbi:unnamed protein product [Rangifer tarandus platyrhynchus]|uniref:Uncharacterized protein n=2 Tax=Rangifer tarandus platyrhynchus TaxID=3082113 RepID=A0ABN8YAK1_RANTA|nr:unnamed protein product [Rangifer tarandus platyrhynchus]
MEDGNQPHGGFCTLDRNHDSWGVLSRETNNTLNRIRCFGEGAGCFCYCLAQKHPGGALEEAKALLSQATSIALQIYTTELKILEWVCSVGCVLHKGIVFKACSFKAVASHKKSISSSTILF